MASGNVMSEYRVPVADTAWFGLLGSPQLQERADELGVELLPDWQNRISMSVPDAYRVRESADEAAAAHVEAEAERQRALEHRVRAAQEWRNETYRRAYAEAMRAEFWPEMRNYINCHPVAMAALEDAERDLDPQVRGLLKSPHSFSPPARRRGTNQRETL